MNRIACFFCVFIFVSTPLVANSNCQYLSNRVTEFRSISPSALTLYHDDLLECDITEINGLPLHDYFESESDVILGYVYLSLMSKESHPVLLDYMIENKRWDLLLETVDMARKMKKSAQISLLNSLFYKPLPDYFQVELKEVFNFFTPAEKIAFSQQVIPNTSQKMKALNRKKNYIYEYWPMFDQMAFIFHLRVMHPYQFEQLSVFWREKLVSYYYSDVEKQDSSFIVLSRLLNLEVVADDIPNANGSLKAYYYLKTNQLNLAEQQIELNKQSYFDLLRYFNFMSESEKRWWLNLSVDINLSDIEMLFMNYYFQIDDTSFREWLWQTAIDQKFNLDQYFDDAYVFVNTLPESLNSKLSTLSPKNDYIQKSSGSLTHRYNIDPVDRINLNEISKEGVSELILFYEYYKSIPYKRSRKILREITPYISVDSSREFCF